jgi:hypothetical protein
LHDWVPGNLYRDPRGYDRCATCKRDADERRRLKRRNGQPPRVRQCRCDDPTARKARGLCQGCYDHMRKYNQDALADHPVSHRTALELFFEYEELKEQGLSFDDCMDALGVKAGTFMKQVSRYRDVAPQLHKVGVHW